MQMIWLLNGLPAEKRHFIILYDLETTYEEFDLLLVMFMAGYPQVQQLRAIKIELI